MSVKKEIFLQIGAHLMGVLQTPDPLDPDKFPKGIFSPEMDLPGLGWFDKQMGQFTTPEQFYGIPLPCILMTFGAFTWSSMGKNLQKGEGVIRFETYFENYADSFTGSINQALALRFFDFTEQVNLALQGFAIPYKMQRLERITDNEDDAQDMVIKSLVEYNTVIFDSSTDSTRNLTLVDADMVVTRLKQTTRPAGTDWLDGFIIT